MAEDLDVKLVISAQNKAKAILDGVQNDLKGVQGTFEKTAQEARKVGGALTAAGAIGAAGIGYLIKQAMDGQAEFTNLATILRNSTDATDEQVNALIEQGKSLEDIGVVSAGAITNGQKMLATFDLLPETIQAITPALADMAVAENGVNVSTEQMEGLANGLGKAMQGQTDLLTKMGFQFDEHQKNLLQTGTETERAAMLTEILNSTYKGTNEAMKNTAAGGMINLQNNLNSLAGDIGDVFIPILNDIVSTIQPIVKKISNWMSENQELTKKIALVVGGIVAFMTVAGPMLLLLSALPSIITGVGVAFAILTGPVGVIILAVTALTAAGVALYKNWDVIKAKISNAAIQIVATVQNFAQSVKDKFNELIAAALEWGKHMLQNFAAGIWEGISNVGESLESAKNFIKEKIGFSKNKDIPTEVWGYHMMQNFAGGIDEGNEEVVDALDETVKKAEERIKAFTETFAELKEKTKEAWREFVDSTKDAKKEYNKSIDDIREKNKELKKSFKEDVANAVLDIRDNIKGLQDELGTSNASFDQKMADQFVDAENTIAESKKKINTELEKADADRDEEKIAELQANIAEQESFLTKHAGLISQLEGAIAEERRVRGLDEVERLMEQKAVEASILQTQIDQEQAILNTHAGTIQQYHNAIKEQRRVRGLDEIALLIENFEIEKSALQTQEDAALEIKQNAMKKARQAYKKHLKNIIQDTERTVGTMATEFDKIPANMGSALEALSNRLINAGSKIKGDQTTNNVNNSKTFSVTVNAGGGEGQNDLLARLGVLLKTI